MNNVYVFDYNGTLEDGSNEALKDAINILKVKYGLTDLVTDDEVSEFDGAPLEDFVAAFFPPHLDASLVLSDLKAELPALDKKYIRAREGVKEVLDFMYFRARAPCWVLSASPANIQEQLKAIGLYDSFVLPTRTYDWLPTIVGSKDAELSDFVSKAVELCKAHPLVSIRHHYQRWPNMQIIYVGDAAVDVIAVHLANRMWCYEWEIPKEFWDKPSEMGLKVISVLLDLKGENNVVIPDDMTRGMRELIEVSRDSKSEYYHRLGKIGHLREAIDKISPKDGTSIEIETDVIIRDLRQIPWIFYPPKGSEEAIK